MIVDKETKLDFPQRDGLTKREHFASIAKQTGKYPNELLESEGLVIEPVPKCGLYIKDIFDQLALTRTWSNGRPERISQADIYYWSKLNDVKLSRKHLNAIQVLDIAQINSYIDCIKEHN